MSISYIKEISKEKKQMREFTFNLCYMQKVIVVLEDFECKLSQIKHLVFEGCFNII